MEQNGMRSYCSTASTSTPPPGQPRKSLKLTRPHACGGPLLLAHSAPQPVPFCVRITIRLPESIPVITKNRLDY